VSTSGDDADTDGYVVIIDGTSQPLPVESNGSVTFHGLAMGPHTVNLTGVAPNCVVDGGSSVIVTIYAPEVAVATNLHVRCSAVGGVQVTVATTGTDLDPNGYTVVANLTSGSSSVRVGIRPSNATAVLRLATGHYVFSLHGVAVNCGPDLGPRELDVVSGTAQSVAFAVVCEPARRLAFVESLNSGNSSTIYSVRSDGMGTVPLTHGLARKTDPAWSPGGTRIAYTSDRDGGRAIYLVNEDASDVKRLTPLTWHSFHPAWSPDGTRIAFVSVRDGNPDVYVMNADGSGELRLTNNPTIDTDPAWSPDGARIAFSSDRAGNHDIYVMSADGSGVTRINNNPTWDRYPAWSPDGSRLAFSSGQCDDPSTSGGCYPVVWVVGPTGPPVGVGFGGDPDWSPDGRKIVVTRFACDYPYYNYCWTIGLWILAPFTDGTSGSRETWDPRLTAGEHSQATWRR
jgi:dipeptidyl aminopeptidase/acylaminoacyl peptidase